MPIEQRRLQKMPRSDIKALETSSCLYFIAIELLNAGNFALQDYKKPDNIRDYTFITLYIRLNCDRRFAASTG
jgi:hypothetical protein